MLRALSLLSSLFFSTPGPPKYLQELKTNPHLIPPPQHQVTGVPVVASKGSKTLVGVLSRKDVVGKDRASGATVRDAMSSPPIAARASSRVADAAGLMLKHKVHRIPVVNSRAELIGIVTRTDIFTVGFFFFV
jgi:CBS domain-containing protein